MSSSATGVGMTICFLGAILLILTQKSSQKFGDVLGIMVLDLFLPKHGVHKDTARYVLSNSNPFGLLSKILVLIWKICFEITHLLNMSHKLGHLSRIFAAEIKNNCIMTLKELLDSLSFDEIAPFRIRHYHTIMRQEIFLWICFLKYFVPDLTILLVKK